ncbi:MAG: hypothetical protein ACD_79C01432G0004 [uncultured bacterium]|nr:MAG: hypothetical protein ACD_79C01432G0004 [uncultured bacterium]
MEKINLSPEEKLCILFSRLKLTDLNCIKTLLNERLNWDYFYKQANHHRIASLIYNHVVEQKLESHFLKEKLILFQNSYNNHEIRNKNLFKDLNVLFEKLSEEKIKVVILKGTSLIPLVYKKFQIRPMSDCDLLIDRKDFNKTENILNEIGYSRESALNIIQDRIVHSWERFIEIKDCGHLGFFKIQDLPYKNYQCIEIHINLFKRTNIIFDDSTRDYFKKRIKTSFERVSVYRLNLNDEFIYLCSHLFSNAIDLYSIHKNSDLRLLRFCDIREFLIQNKDIVLNLQILPESIKRAVIFTLQAIYLIYNEQYFSEIINYSKITNEYFNRAYWKLKNIEHFMELDIPFMKRLFSLTPPEYLQTLVQKVNKEQTDSYVKSIGKIKKIISNNDFISCKEKK